MNDKFEKALSEIQDLREKNNKLWMGYVRLAYQHAPEEAAALHKQIRRIDAKVTRLGKQLDSSDV